MSNRDYFKEIEKHENGLIKKMGKLNIDLISIVTDEPYAVPLKKFFRKRKMVR